MIKKKTQGRRKIEIKQIINLATRQVTFSKRRTGIFNKASELCVLTGAETAIIVQSPGGRVFAFGHPSVDSVVEKYLDGSSSKSQENCYPVNEQNINPTCMHENFIQKYKEITKELEDEKGKKKVLDNKVIMDGRPYWWEESFKDLGLEELEKYIVSMEALKNKLTTRANEMAMIRNSSGFEGQQSLTSEGLDGFAVEENNIGGDNIDRMHGFMVEENINAGDMLPYPPGLNFGQN